MSTPARRSTRNRKHTPTIYEEAKAELRRVSPKQQPNNNKRGRGKKKKKDDEFSESDEESTRREEEEEEVQPSDDEEEEESSSSDSEESDSEELARPKKKKSPQKIHVQYKTKSTKKNASTKAKKSVKGAAKTRLTALRNKTLDPRETPDNSLTAAILQACTTTAPAAPSDTDTTIAFPDAFQATEYTPCLQPICDKLLRLYQTDANRAHVDLLNLIFRSVGGNYSTGTLDPATTPLEEMDDDQWEQVVTSIVDDMRHTPHDAILSSACPQGAVHANDATKHNPAQEDYRRILDHFWYLLGTLSLASSSNCAGASFDIERVRDLAMRMMELVTVGQPDLRSAACQSALMLALAACDGSLAFHSRLATAQRQWKAAQAAQTTTRAKALEQTVEYLERSCDDLEHVVTHTIIPGVFMRRYRDSNAYIRAFCLDTLSQMILRRPDLFLRDIYLKYYGWMMSDKDAVVRVAALKGLLLPFQAAEEQAKERSSNHLHPKQIIDLPSMEKVVGKFLPTIADRVIDVSVEVQQQAVKLLVALMRHGFMDEVEDESVWNRINLRALAPDASPSVRKDALYFILEQLEAFDIPPSKSGGGPTAQQKVFQIDSLAVWVGHALSDGRIPIEHMKVHLADYVVQSLREMPEHSHLVTDWSAMIQAIENDVEANFDKSETQRVTAAKQRVLLHMLATAAALEFESGKGEDDIVDEGLTKVRSQLRPSVPVVTPGKKKKGKKQSDNISKERLTVGLLKALPQLLEAFKGNITVLRSLTTLPRFFVVSVITLPQRKKDVQAVVNLLGDLFLESTDTTILQNTCLALTVLAKGGDHARNLEVLLKLKEVAVQIQDRLFQLWELEVSSGMSTSGGSSRRHGSTRRRLSLTPGSQEDAATREDTHLTEDDTTLGDGNDELLDQQHAILLCLRRLRILSKKWYLGVLLARDTDQDASQATMEDCPSIHLCSVVAKLIAKELGQRRVVMPDDESTVATEKTVQLPAIWTEVDPGVHRVVAAAIGEGLQMILAVTAFRLRRAMIREEKEIEKLNKKRNRGDDSDEDVSDDDEDEDMAGFEDATVATALEGPIKDIMRGQVGLAKLVTMCFDMHLEEDTRFSHEPSPEHKAFCNTVQILAGKAASDLRTLFPREWDDCASPLLRQAALEPNGNMVGGFVRFFRDNEENFVGPNSGKAFRDKLLLPLARGLCGGFQGKRGNRREAGFALRHIVHPSEEMSKAVGVVNKTLKHLDSVRLVESYMACLRQEYTDWVEMEPLEPESDRPTEQELVDFAASEQAHGEAFNVLVHKASRLSASLGVGKLTEGRLYDALFGFLNEGIRFAFSSEEEDGDDSEFLLGSRLSFLFILSKFLNWMKKKKPRLKQLCDTFVEKEEELRLDPDFSEVHDEDMEAVEHFRRGLGLSKAKTQKKAKVSPTTPASMVDDIEEDDDSFVTPLARASNKRRRLSQASAASSVRSARSGSLAPVYEGDESEDDDVPIKTLKQRKRSPKPKETIVEASDEEDSLSSVESSRDKRKPTPKPKKTAKEASDDEGSMSSGSSLSSAKKRKLTPKPKKTKKEASDDEGSMSSNESSLSSAKKRKLTPKPKKTNMDSSDEEGSSSDESSKIKPTPKKRKLTPKPKETIMEASDEGSITSGSSS